VAATSNYFFAPSEYDAVYGHLNSDLETLIAEMRRAPGRVLEVCCGNGRVLIPALDAGIAIDGLDLDPAMLADLREKLGDRARHVTLHEADMRSFALGRRYALIVVPFNSFLHNLTQADQLATLRRCLDHLEPEGRLILVVFHPSAAKLVEFVEHEVEVFDVAFGDGRLRVFDRAVDDRVEQIRNVSRRVEHIAADGRKTDERHYDVRLRYVFKPEMELLFRVAGFARSEVRPLFDGRGFAGGVLAGDRAPREGDVLMWTAWKS